MQEQISLLSSAVHSLTNSLPQSSRSDSTPRTQTQAPTQTQTQTQQTQAWPRRFSSVRELTFTGPTTSAFSFDLAKTSLQQRGIVGGGDHDLDKDADGDLTQEPSPMPSPPYPSYPPVREAVDPLWTIERTEAMRLCRVYEEEMGMMYPVLDLGVLLQQVHVLYTGTTTASSPGVLKEHDVHILRIVFACALTAEASGGSELAVRLFESVRAVADDCVWGIPEIKRIIFLTLVVSAQKFNPASVEQMLRMNAVHLLLSNGRGNACLAHYRHRRTHVSRNRPQPSRNSRPSGSGECSRWERPSFQTVLVRLHPRPPLELRDGYALRS